MEFKKQIYEMQQDIDCSLCPAFGLNDAVVSTLAQCAGGGAEIRVPVRIKIFLKVLMFYLIMK